MLGYLIVTIIVAILGVFGNVLVLATLIMDRKLQVLNNIFLANLAIADLFIAGIVHPFAAVGIARENDSLFVQENGEVTYLCEFLASFCVISCSASVLSIGSVAINRYVYICHNRAYPKIYNMKTVPFMVAMIWIIGALLDLPLYFGFGDHVFHDRLQSCFLDTVHPQYKVFFVIAGILSPVIITVYCYVRIVHLVYQANKRLREQNKNKPGAKQKSAIRSSDVRLLKTVAGMAVLAVIIYTPYSFTLLLDDGDVHGVIWRFSNGVMHSFSCLDWIIYAVSNNRIRKGIAKVLLRLTCGKCVLETRDLDQSQTATSMGRSTIGKTLATTGGSEDDIDDEDTKTKTVQETPLTSSNMIDVKL